MTTTTDTYIRDQHKIERMVRSPLFWIVFTMLAFSYPIIRSVYRTLPPDLPIIAKVPQFQMTNEYNKPFGSKDLEGKVYIASFAFTNCPTICPSLMTELQSIQKRVRGLGQQVAVLTFSVDPENDTPKMLYKYARSYKSNPHVWKFLTGEKAQMKELLVKGFLVPMGNPEALESENMEDDMVMYDIAHTEKLVLVDGRGNIRGFYSTDKNDVNKLMIDIGLLINHPTHQNG